MSRITALNRIATTVALGASLSACEITNDHVDELRGGMVLAQAEPAPPAESIELRSDSVMLPPTPVTVTYDEAASAFRRGRYREAAILFSLYVEANPEDPAGQYMLGLSAWKTGSHDRATQALLRAVELDSLNVKARTNLGRVLLEQGRGQDALVHVEKAVELTPQSYEAWRVLGNVKSLLGQDADALYTYRQALVLNDRDAWSMNGYALVLIRQGRYEDAIGPLALAVEVQPQSAVFQTNLGIALEGSGFLGSALQAFNTAVRLDSTLTRAKVSLERVQQRLNMQGAESIELSTFARSFAEQIERWIIAGRA
jgi:tetratricopeptide (TPR) repeat protein